MISQKTVQEILETSKVEDIVEEFVNLKKRGVNMIGLCPFHNEKTPSFTVSPSKNIFKCFGCGKGGGPVQFLMEHENMTFPDALRYLAKRYNIEIEETETSQEAIEERQQMESLYLVNDYAKKYFQKNLFDTDAGKSIALSYFKQRGFREETIRKFGLGFAPVKKDAFTLTAINDGYNIELLRKLGLTTSYSHDFFRERVMFTIHNLTGKVIAFAGRILQKNVKAPKYINSPETEIYIKSKVLYGAYFAKQSIRKLDECILVEGYTDVISLHQSGIENVVASSGTSLTVNQISLVKRYTPNIKILYDGDAAGVKAALRGLDLVLEQDMNVKVVLLPKDEDPDSYLQKVGVTAFKEYLDQEAKDFILFKTDLLLKEAGDDPIKKANFVKDIINSIAKIPDAIKRSVYIKECSRLLGIKEHVLVSESNKSIVQIINKRKQRRDRDTARKQREHEASFPNTEYPAQGEEQGTGQQTDATPNKQNTKAALKGAFQEKDLVRILISHGGEIFEDDEDENNITVAEFLIGDIQESIDDFENKLYGKVVRECLQLLLENKTLTTEHFINHSDTAISQLAVDLIHTPYEFSPGWKERDIVLQTQKDPEKNFTLDSIQSLLRFKLRKVMKTLDLNLLRIKEADTEEKKLHLTKVHMKLLEVRNELAKKLNTIVLK